MLYDSDSLDLYWTHLGKSSPPTRWPRLVHWPDSESNAENRQNPNGCWNTTKLPMRRRRAIEEEGHRENSKAPGKSERWGPLRAKRAENFHGLEINYGKLLLVYSMRPLEFEALGFKRPWGNFLLLPPLSMALLRRAKCTFCPLCNIGHLLWSFITFSPVPSCDLIF